MNTTLATAVIGILASLLQAICVGLLFHILGRLNSLADKMEDFITCDDCHNAMKIHDIELKAIGDTILKHEGRISKLEGINA